MIAIDLGTTHSLAAVWQDGRAQLIPNALGEVLTPSAVFVDERKLLLVGRAARDRWLAQPERGAVAFKRHMGTQRRLCPSYQQDDDDQRQSVNQQVRGEYARTWG